MHPLHGNPYSLTLISIDGHLHSLLIRLVAVRLSSPFLSSPQPPFYSTYSVMSMAHTHVLRESWKGLRTSKVWNNCLACHRGCAWFEYFVWCRWSIARLYDFVGIAFFGHVILWRHSCFVSMLEVLLFLCQHELLSWIFWIWIFIPQLRRITLKLCQVALRIKNSVFIIYLLEDEQELSLGMLDTSPTYL